MLADPNLSELARNGLVGFTAAEASLFDEAISRSQVADGETANAAPEFNDGQCRGRDHL